jgi:mono/diheme cytochrome c family protein
MLTGSCPFEITRTLRRSFTWLTAQSVQAFFGDLDKKTEAEADEWSVDEHRGVHMRRFIAGIAVVLVAGMVVTSLPAGAQGDAVTFTKDIAPILQRSCQNCHRPDSIAPMSFLTYEDVRPWVKAIKERTLLRNGRGAMPPWFIEREIGIQKFKDDISLSDAEIAKIAKWADSGAPRGNPGDLPPARVFADTGSWQIGTPDLIVTSPTVEMKAINPDY